MQSRSLDNILLTAVQNTASDVHLIADRKPYMRVAGRLMEIEGQTVLTKEDTFGFAKSILNEKQLEKVSNLKEVDFALSFKDSRMRGVAFLKKDSIGIILRIIPPIRTLAELNLPETLAQFAHKEQGLFLVVGPVGQGKTTTMASLINLINKERTEHIVTIEDPIEYVFKEDKSIIDQREVKVDTRSFSSGLKSIFRQDVDVIMVGEMRGYDTMATVVTAAETGHLVLSTLHTNNAAQTVDRIIDSFPAIQQNQVRTQLSTSLLGILSQRLVMSKKDGGLIPAYELMINNKAIANLIREGKTYEIDAVIQTSASEGMIDMNRSLLSLVKQGHIDIEDAYRYSTDPDALKSMI